MATVSHERVRAKVKTEVARILQTELKDPRLGFVTVIDCELTRDWRHATIKISILADREGEERRILAALESAKTFVQNGVASRLRTRVTPFLTFELDKGPEKSIKLAALLDDLRRDREEREALAASDDSADAEGAEGDEPQDPPAAP